MVVIMENCNIKICARCGQPVHREKESWKQVGSDVEHTTCPTSEALQSLPRLGAGAAGSAPAPAAGPHFLTMDEAAEMLRVSVQTIRRRIRAGDLPARRLKGGQTVLIEQSDLLALLEDVQEA